MVIHMHISYLINQAWHWLAGTGINLAILLVIALLIPRVGRLVERFVERDVKAKADKEESKNTLAYAGVLIYIGQIVAFFLLSIAFLQQLGFSLAGAAIPATVVSAAIGFGAQSIIADFLAGFFILTEKQYGVGDWVRFMGNGVEVEGTVIQITMRATQIRTLAQETVVVANSTARVSINTSNYWSRAVIVMPVPLLGSDSPTDAADRAEAATRRALEDESVAEELIGELDVQPGVSVNPPATVGMPWTVDMRFMVQVEPGSQWAVERAVRMAILEEFWDEYGSATTTSGELSDSVRRPAKVQAATSRSRPVTDRVPAVAKPHDEDPSPEVEDSKKNAESSTPPAEKAEADGSDPAALSVSGGHKDEEELDELRDGPRDGDGDRDADTRTTIIPAVAATSTKAGPADAETAGADPVTDRATDPATDEPADGTEDTEDVRWHPLKRVLSVNGRFRPSSTLLALLLLVLLFLRSLTISGETAAGEQVSGPLAPPAATSVAPVPTSVPTPAPAPQLTTPPQAPVETSPTAPTTPPTEVRDVPATPAPTVTDTPATGQPAPRQYAPAPQTTAPAPTQTPATTAGTTPTQESPTTGALN